MSKDFFSKEEFKQRWDKVRSSMKKFNIELLMVISPTNINYLIGTPAKGYQEFEVLFFPIDLIFFSRSLPVGNQLLDLVVSNQ